VINYEFPKKDPIAVYITRMKYLEPTQINNPCVVTFMLQDDFPSAVKAIYLLTSLEQVSSFFLYLIYLFINFSAGDLNEANTILISIIFLF
jgi:hypothetical protein